MMASLANEHSSISNLGDGTAIVPQISAQASIGTPQPVGAEFRANTYTQDYQYSPSVAALAGVGFVVTWTSKEQDGSGFGIYGHPNEAVATQRDTHNW